MKLVNYTRYSVSIPRRLLREKFYLLPFYYLMRTSCLAKEGMEHSGSYLFADHIYRGKAKGALGIGWLIDRVILSLPAARSFRNRYRHSRDRILEYLRDADPRPCRVLSIPCGLPRDLVEASLVPHPLTRFYALDIDPDVISEARDMIGTRPNFELIRGDAFHLADYPAGIDVITSSGFAEFLDDDELIRFYQICYSALNPGGVLISSSTVRNRFSDYLLTELAELRTHYRDERAVSTLFKKTSFDRVELERDPVGYQVLIRASKAPC